MYLQSIPLSVIGDRAHGEKSINGVKVVEKGPMTKNALNHVVDTASQKGVTLTCKEMKSALLYSDHKMYKKLKVGTDIGKLKILPVNGGKLLFQQLRRKWDRISHADRNPCKPGLLGKMGE